MLWLFLALWLCAVTHGCTFDARPLKADIASLSRIERYWQAPQPKLTAADDAAVGWRSIVGSAPDSALATQDAGAASAPGAATAAGSRAPVTSADQSTRPDGGLGGLAQAQATQPDATAAAAEPAAPCGRAELAERADAYLQAMADGDPQSLNLHPALRYTENGQDQTLGLGLWLSRPQTQFARHALDEQRCASVTEAVLTRTLGRVVLGVRLRYVEGQLLDVEAHVVPEMVRYFDPDGIIPSGADTWVQPVPSPRRMARDAMVRLATDYFDSTTDPALLPHSSPNCQVRQNGAMVANCAVMPGGGRFEQVRFAVVDTTAGMLAAITRHVGNIGIFLFKIEADTLYGVEIIGGASSQSAGW